MNAKPPIPASPSTEGSRESATTDPTAFAEFVLKSHRLVRTYLAKYVLDLETVDRLAREVFLQFAAQQDFAEVTSQQLLALARERATSYLENAVAAGQQQPGNRVATLLGRWQIARLQAERVSERQHLAALAEVQRSVEGLAPSSGAMLDAHYHQGKSAETIGATTGRDPSEIRQTLLKLRTTLFAD